MKSILNPITVFAVLALLLCSCSSKKVATANKSGEYSGSMKAHPDSTALLVLGQSLKAEGKYEEAIEVYEKYISYLTDAPTETVVTESKKEPVRVMQTPQNSGGHFAWGADLGSSIDMTGNAMTSINIGACFGYRNNWFRMLGIGADINMMMSNSSRSIPVYGIMQTSFSNRPRLCFMDLRAGVSMNNIENLNTQSAAYGSLGLGVTLAHSSKFASHLILAYSFIQRKNFDTPEGVYQLENLQSATLRIGICF